MEVKGHIEEKIDDGGRHQDMKRGNRERSNVGSG